MNTKFHTVFENISRHLACGFAALVAGGIALGMAAGPVEAKSPLPLGAMKSTHIILIL